MYVDGKRWGKMCCHRRNTQVKIIRSDDDDDDDYDDDDMICLLPNNFLFIIYPAQFTLHNLSNMNTNYHLPFNICL